MNTDPLVGEVHPGALERDPRGSEASPRGSRSDRQAPHARRRPDEGSCPWFWSSPGHGRDPKVTERSAKEAGERRKGPERSERAAGETQRPGRETKGEGEKTTGEGEAA